MTLAEKYGFSFIRVPDGFNDPVVRAFAVDHFNRYGYRPDTTPNCEVWVAVVDKENVYCVFGWRKNDDFQAIEFPDFYARPTKRGVLACFAALERIRADADRSNNVVFTATPGWNTKMINAIRREFGFKGAIRYDEGVDPPSFVVTVYDPKLHVLKDQTPHETIALTHMAALRQEVPV